MNNPTLSICIPTYNRANELSVCLDSICKQFELEPQLKTAVEIVISDNASTDNTTEIVSEFQKRYPQIQYIRNENNVGFDRNVLNVVSHSHGEYCLTLGDDDAIFEGGIKEILDLITKTKSSYINLNHWGYNHTLTAPVVPHPNRAQTEDIVYDTLREFVLTIQSPMQLVGTFGGMSTQLFKRDPWLHLENKERFIGTNTIHLFLILEAFKELPSTFMKHPTVMTRDNNLRWDSFPGLETEKRRAEKTAAAAIWISDLYELKMSANKIKIKLAIRALSNVLKGLIKKTLYRFGWRRKRMSI